MKKGKRGFCAFLCAVLLFLLVPPVRAAETLYFTAVNEVILELQDETMPFYDGGTLYVPCTVLDGGELGVFYSVDRDRRTLLLFRMRDSLLFDLESGTATDRSGTTYNGSAALRGDVVYFPLALAADYFGLSYSSLRISYGYLIRITGANALLSDKMLLDAATATLANRYTQYERAKTSGQSAAAQEETKPAQPEREKSVVYFLTRMTDADSTEEILSELDACGGRATFLLDGALAPQADDLLRRAVGTGHALALQIDASGGADAAMQAIRAGNERLWAACNCKTRLVMLQNGDRAAERAVRDAGYCVLTPDVSYRAGEGAQAFAARVLADAEKHQGTSCALLGGDAGVRREAKALFSALQGERASFAALCETRP